MLDTLDPRYHIVIPRRARRGANFMDKKYPGWEHRVSLDELVMAEGNACIIGQAVGDYSSYISDVKSLDGVGLGCLDYGWYTIGWEVHHGFISPNVLNGGRHWQQTGEMERYEIHQHLDEEYYSLLTKNWEHEFRIDI